jgi:hypothetical protein
MLMMLLVCFIVEVDTGTQNAFLLVMTGAMIRAGAVYWK